MSPSAWHVNYTPHPQNGLTIFFMWRKLKSKVCTQSSLLQTLSDLTVKSEVRVHPLAHLRVISRDDSSSPTTFTSPMQLAFSSTHPFSCKSLTSAYWFTSTTSASISDLLHFPECFHLSKCPWKNHRREECIHTDCKPRMYLKNRLSFLLVLKLNSIVH